MEEHRARIEAEHNEGIAREEWESMEQILEGFVRDFKDMRLCARTYAINETEFRRWLEKRKPRGLTMRIYTEAVANREAVVTQCTIRQRRHRGMDPIAAASTPPVPRSECGKRAMAARWGRGY